MRIVAIALAALLIAAPVASAHHGTTSGERCNEMFPQPGGGLVGIVQAALYGTTCLSLNFVDGASHLTLCLLSGGPGC